MSPVRATLLALAAIGSFSLPHCHRHHHHAAPPPAVVNPDDPLPPPPPPECDDDDDSTDWGPFGHHDNGRRNHGNSDEHRQDGDHR